MQAIGTAGGYNFDTGNLNKTADWIAGKTKMVLDCNFDGIFYFFNVK